MPLQVSKYRSPSCYVFPPGLRSARATRAEDVRSANMYSFMSQKNCNTLPMYEQAREILNSCMSKFGQDGWLSLRSDCGQMLLQLSLATLDTVTMVQVRVTRVYSFHSPTLPLQTPFSPPLPRCRHRCCSCIRKWFYQWSARRSWRKRSLYC